jgi:hypothetical protein
MSNRQQRNQKKARRRREKVLGSFPAVPGFRIYADLRDYGTGLCFCMVRQTDGLQRGVQTQVDRLWRHMESLPQRMVDRLLDGFAPLTPKDC